MENEYLKNYLGIYCCFLFEILKIAVIILPARSEVRLIDLLL